MRQPAAIGAGLLVAIVLLGVGHFAPAHSPPQRGAVDAVETTSGWADESRCADCHEQAETFAQNREEVRSISKDEYFLDKNESFPQLELSLRAHCDGHRS